MIKPVCTVGYLVAVTLALSGCGGAGGVGVVGVVGVTVTPSSATVQAGGVQQFTARVSPSGANQAVTWSVSGAGCTGASCGTIDATGRYTAPATVPAPPTAAVMARSNADPTKAATATVTIISAQPPANLAGTWDGTWASRIGGGSGTFVATLSQSGFTLSGTVSVTGAQCPTTPLAVSGGVTGNNFFFDDSLVEEFSTEFRGTVNPPGTSGSGTYSFCSGFPPAEDTGTFSMTRR